MVLREVLGSALERADEREQGILLPVQLGFEPGIDPVSLLDRLSEQVRDRRLAPLRQDFDPRFRSRSAVPKVAVPEAVLRRGPERQLL